LQRQYSSRAQACFARLNRDLNRIEPLRDSEVFFERILSRAFRNVDVAPDPKKELARSIYSLKKRFPHTFSFVVWEKDGTMVETLTDEKGYRFVLKKIREGLMLVTRLVAENPSLQSLAKTPELKPYVAPLASYVGRSMVIDDVAIPLRTFPGPKVLLVNTNPARSHFWFRFGSQFGLICFIGIDALRPYPGLNTAVRGIRPSLPGAQYGFWHLAEKEELVMPHQQPFEQELREKLLSFDTSSEMNLETEHLLIALRSPDAGVRLFGLVEKSRHLPDLEQSRRMWLALIILGALPFWRFLYALLFPSREKSLSVLVKLTGLFLAANLIPLGVLLFLGVDFLQSKEASLAQEKRRHLLHILRSTDVGYLEFGQYMNDRVRPLADYLIEWPVSGMSRGQASRILRCVQRLRASEAMIVASSTQVFRKLSEELGQTSIVPNEMAKRVGYYVFTSLGNTEARGTSFHLEIQESEKSILEAQGLMDNRLRGGAKIRDFSFLITTGKATYLVIQEKNSNTVNYALGVFWEEHRFKEMYLNTLLRQWRKKPGLEKTLFFRQSDGGILPKNVAVSGDVRRFIAETQKHQDDHSRIVVWKGQPWLAVGLNGNQVGGHVLVALHPLRLIREEIRVYRLRLAGFACISLLLMVVIGIFLSRNFLSPVRFFAEAAEAIQARNFTYRLPAFGGDELGKLAETLNSVMAGLKELEVARLVQESLFPDSALEFGDLRVFGKTFTMREVGGDLFEYRPMPLEKSLRLFLGDVAGHGVPAALVMVIAKTGLGIHQVAGDQPAEMLGRLNRLIGKLSSHGKKRMLTAGYFLISAETGRCRFSNAGHAFPLHIRKRGNTGEFVKLIGYPLGSMKRAQFTELEFVLEPGDSLVLYSDGFVENRSPSGEEFGYGRFQEAAKNCWSPDPEEFFRRLNQVFEEFRSTAPGQDDVTLIIVNRRDEAYSLGDPEKNA
jgi:hypothetical protein